MAATVASLALAVAAAGAGAYSASETAKATKTANAKKGQVLGRVPPPAYIAALQRMTARTLAANQGAVPPSFTDYVRSGGKATFPVNFTAPTPGEATALGFVGKDNSPTPFFDVNNQTTLTPEQVLFGLTNPLGERAFGPVPKKYGKTVAREQDIYGQLSRGLYGRQKEAMLARQLANTQRRRHKLETTLFPNIDPSLFGIQGGGGGE